MSDTPRTDTIFDPLRRYEYGAAQEEQKLIDLCRSFERELTAEKQRSERLEKALREALGWVPNGTEYARISRAIGDSNG